jgi:hypothetical protein
MLCLHPKSLIWHYDTTNNDITYNEIAYNDNTFNTLIRVTLLIMSDITYNIDKSKITHMYVFMYYYK